MKKSSLKKLKFVETLRKDKILLMQDGVIPMSMSKCYHFYVQASNIVQCAKAF